MNRKRVRRLYRLDGLQLRMRVRRRKHRALHCGPASMPTGPCERWSMDVVHETLVDGRPFRILTVVDHWSRSSPVVEARGRMSGSSSASSSIASWARRRGQVPSTVDHGTEFQSCAPEDYASRRGVQLDFTRPGKPVEYAFIESCNGQLRDECLNVHQFASLAEAQAVLDAWLLDYNTCRAHSSLGHLTPSEFVSQRQEEWIVKDVDCSG